MPRTVRITVALYVLALVASWLVQSMRSGREDDRSMPAGVDAMQVRTGPVGDEPITIASRSAGTGALGQDPILLLHGSPGDSSNFARLMPELARRGWTVHALDLPGFGYSTRGVADHSIKANARAVLAWMGAKGIAQAHAVGWSNGGGTGLWMADLAPHRVTSLTLLASIGVQEHEQTGSYAFEHIKYRIGLAALRVLPACVPHFGLLGTPQERTGWLRNFADTDQRQLRPLMQRLAALHPSPPVLILHGAHDVLVPLASAEVTHRLLPQSRLLVTDANHFQPFLQAGQTAAVLDAFARGPEGRSGAGLVPAAGERIDRWERPERTGAAGLLAWLQDGARALPWWMHLACIALLASRRPGWGVGLAALLLVGPACDPLVALLGVCGGVGARVLVLARQSHRMEDRARRELFISADDWTRRLGSPCSAWVEGWRGGVLTGWRDRAARGAGAARAPALGWACFWSAAALGVLAWSVLSVLAASIAFAILQHELAPLAHGLHVLLGWVLLVVGVWKAGWTCARVPELLSMRGWRWARIWFERLIHREYWPTWAWYAMISPWLIGLAIRYRSLTCWLAANPSIPRGGGLVGESKGEILRMAGSHDQILRWALVPPDDDANQRGCAGQRAMAQAGLEFPIIAKPDMGERGHGVRLVRSSAALREALAHVRGDVLLQEYHAGPKECGILWARRVEGPDADGLTGFIYSITAKEFPRITGDGVRTLEDLIEAHPRFRRQHLTFLMRHAQQASRVLAKGEELPLALAGNHCQGTMFFDGTHLLTPALARAIDEIASRFGESIGRPASLDYARFDVRYSSDEDLREGRGFAICEVNGTSAESTNIYDPHKGLAWSIRTLVGQWRVLVDLGAWRVARGEPAPTLAGLRRMLREVRVLQRERAGSPVSD